MRISQKVKQVFWTIVSIVFIGMLAYQTIDDITILKTYSSAICTKIPAYTTINNRRSTYSFSCPTPSGMRIVKAEHYRGRRGFDVFGYISGVTWKNKMRVHWPNTVDTRNNTVIYGKVDVLFDFFFTSLFALVISIAIFYSFFPNKKP